MFAYSLKKNTAQRKPEYSVIQPATSSDSASGSRGRGGEGPVHCYADNEFLYKDRIETEAVSSDFDGSNEIFSPQQGRIVRVPYDIAEAERLAQKEMQGEPCL